MMKPTSIIYILSALLIWTSPVYAWYQVEAIIFEYTNPDTGNEYWDSEPGLVPLIGSVEPVPEIIHPEPLDQAEDVLVEAPAPRLVPYMMLAEKKYRLGGIMQALRQSRAYRPIYHVSWQQPQVDGNQARALHLQLEDSRNLYEVTIPPTLAENIPPEFYEPIKLLFDGIIRIRSSMYLHVDVDMVLFRQPPMSSSVVTPSVISATGAPESVQDLSISESPPAYVRLQETRRIRLNELHYFDHPLFGVILQVSRYAPD